MIKYSQYIGIIIGAIYGIIIRIIGGIEILNDYYSIYSITFIWITPIIICLLPIFITSNRVYKSNVKQFFLPFISIIVFFLLALSTRLEDALCLLILGIPFFIIAGVIGVVAAFFVKKWKIKKGIYSILIVPLILNPIENLYPNNTKIFSIENSIIVNEDQGTIWENILEVPEIKNEEYNPGFFNFIGVPRPIKSETYYKDGLIFRRGYFTDNLILVESISNIVENKYVNFKIHIDQSILRNTPTDRHLLKSKYFSFQNISYKLEPINKKTYRIILRCEYKIESKMNFYANFWASKIINDFEKRLLDAIKLKLEK